MTKAEPDIPQGNVSFTSSSMSRSQLQTGGNLGFDPNNINQAELAEKARKVTFQVLFGIESASSAVAEFIERLKQSDKDFDEHVGLLTGAILTLFGGQFATTFAFVEAFHQTGWNNLVESGCVIRDQLRNAKSAMQQDDLLDENQDGTADVLVLTPDQLATRKLNVFLNNVDPDAVHRALSAMWLGFLSASAAVKLKFANIIALGASLGEFIERPAQKYLLPRLREALDPKYHRWLPSMIGYLSRMIGISIAFRLNRVLATISTAIRGGDMLLANFALLCRKRGVEFLTRGPADDMVAVGVVAAGIYAQLFGPQSSILLRLALFPLSITEQLLTFWVGTN